jgi:hypothetical protein
MVFVKRRRAGFAVQGLVEGFVAEHGEENIRAAACEGDEGLVVAFAFGSFAVVVSARRRVVQGRKGGEEQGAFDRLHLGL